MGAGGCGCQQGGGDGRKVRTVVYLHSDGVGHGDQKLAEVLMGAYLETLMHFAGSISHILLINSGVKIIGVDSPFKDYMSELAGVGVIVLACGTCVKHFELSEKLAVGKVSNMVEIVTVLSEAEKVLSP